MLVTYYAQLQILPVELYRPISSHSNPLRSKNLGLMKVVRGQSRERSLRPTPLVGRLQGQGGHLQVTSLGPVELRLPFRSWAWSHCSLAASCLLLHCQEHLLALSCLFLCEVYMLVCLFFCPSIRLSYFHPLFFSISLPFPLPCLITTLQCIELCQHWENINCANKTLHKAGIKLGESLSPFLEIPKIKWIVPLPLYPHRPAPSLRQSRCVKNHILPATEGAAHCGAHSCPSCCLHCGKGQFKAGSQRKEPGWQSEAQGQMGVWLR